MLIQRLSEAVVAGYDPSNSIPLPDGWLAAGPGRRQQAGDGAGFRFDPGAPVHEVALIASDFETYAIDIEGVHLELLL